MQKEDVTDKQPEENAQEETCDGDCAECESCK